MCATPPAASALNAAAGPRFERAQQNRRAENATTPSAKSPGGFVSAKGFLHQLGSFQFRSAKQRVQQLDFREAAEERQNHRLNRQIIASGSERVAPRFEIMRRPEHATGSARKSRPRDNRAGQLRALSFAARPNRAAPLSCRSSCQSARRVVDRVAAENEELFDPAFVYVRRELEDARLSSGCAATGARRSVWPTFFSAALIA